MFDILQRSPTLGSLIIIIVSSEDLPVPTWLVDVPVAGVDDLQRPPALGALSPEVDAEEGPVVEVGADDVSGPLEEQRARGAHGRGEQQAQVTSREEAQRHLALNVLQVAHLVQRADTGVHVHGDRQRAAVRQFDLSADQTTSMIRTLQTHTSSENFFEAKSDSYYSR